MNRHERCKHYQLPVHCGFCGQRVLGDSENWEVSPCDHTAYIITDEGVEYISEQAQEKLHALGYTFEEAGQPEPVSGKDEDFDGISWDELTDKLKFTDGLKVAVYVRPPSGFGTYVGFTPE